MSGLVPKARAKQQEGEAYKARCRHQDAARAFREAADLFSRAAEHMATDPVKRRCGGGGGEAKTRI